MFDQLSWTLVLAMLIVGFYFAWLGRPQRDSEDLQRILKVKQEKSVGLVKRLDLLEIRIAPALFVLGVFTSCLFVTYLFLALFPEQLLLALASGAVTAVLSVFVINDLAQRRVRKFEVALPDTVGIMQAAAAVGVPPLEVLEIGANANSGFKKAILQEVVSRLKVGGNIVESTLPLKRRYDGESVNLFVSTLITRWQAGVNFSCLLTALSNILRERASFREQFHGKLSGARYALLFAAFFPYLLIPYLLWYQPLWLVPLTQHSFGPTLVFSAVVCQMLGFLWMRKIIRSHIL